MSRERIAINDLTERSELAALANNPGLTLDVTNLDLGRLPENVKAALYTEATTFSAPQLRTSGAIYVPRARQLQNRVPAAPAAYQNGVPAATATRYR